MNCVNKSSKEFKSLAAKNNVSDNTLELIVHKYWKETGSEELFPSDSYIQAQLGAISYEEPVKAVKELWQKKYSGVSTYNTFDDLQKAMTEASKYFPAEAIVYYKNADGKYSLLIKKPVVKLGKALDEIQRKGYLEARKESINTEDNKEYGVDKAKELFNKFNVDRTSLPLADKIFKLADTIGIKVVFSNSLKDGSMGAFGHNTILLNKDFYENSNSNDKKAATILHELIHAITTYAISDKVDTESLSKPLQEFRKDIHQLFTKLQYNPALKDERGVLNEREFIAELSNPIFRQKIQAIDNNRKESFWQRVVNAVKKLLGIHSSSPYYTRMMNTLDKAINAFDIKTYMEYNGLNNALRQGANDDVDYNTLSTEDIKKEIHDYVNSLTEGAVKSKEALHSFINDLTESDIKNIYSEIEQNRNDVNLVVGKLRQLARDKKSKDNQKYFTFKDGKSVKAPFIPNDQQTEALDKIDNFLKSNKKVMTLSGYAGTGKTSIMEMIAEKAKIDGKKIIFTATTNKATQVLKAKVEHIGFPVMTANKAFGIALEPGDKQEYDADDLKAVLVESKVAGSDAAIIDEASMISQENFDILTSIAKETGLKIIFVGDVAQLPPVERGNDSVKLSPVFTNKQGDVITLTKVERTGDNAILKEATNLRDGEELSGVSSFNKDGKGVAYIKPSSQEERDKIIKTFAPKMKDDLDYFRILTYSNKSVAQYNDTVRRLLGYNDNTPRVGEIILGYANYDYNKQTRQYGFINSGSYKVVSVAPSKVKKIHIEGEIVSLDVVPVTIEGIDGGTHTYDMVDIKGNEANKKAVTKIAKALSNLWAQWKAAQTKGQRGAILDVINGLEKSLFVNDNIFNERGYKLLNKRYDFGYAMTIHKSQGSTFKNVLLDDINVAMYNEYLDKEALKKAATHVHTDTSNVDLSKNTVASEHSNIDNAQVQSSMSISGLFDDVPVTTPSTTQSISQEQSTANNDIDNMVDIRRQLEYVGVSRATDTVTIISNNVKKEGSPLKADKDMKSVTSSQQNNASKSINDKIQKHRGNWSREEAIQNPNILYVFTDNTNRDSGHGIISDNSWYSKKYGKGHHFPTMTAAVVRGLENARPISTQRWYHQGAKGITGRWTDADIDEFKSVIRKELQEIVNEFNTGKYDSIMFPVGDGLFNTNISNITKERVPKLYQALGELLHEFGLDNLVPSDIKLNNKSIASMTSTVNTKGTYINHSGGAVGSDSYWGEIGAKYGIASKHYYREGSKTPNGNTPVSDKELAEANVHVTEANKTLNRRFPTSNEYVNNLLRRNWFQVKNSDAIFAVSTIASNNTVNGGTGWAIQMAIDNEKPVHVFDQDKGKWFEYNYSTKSWKETGTPTLTYNFAGIGTRELNNTGKKAIEDVYKKTFDSSSSALANEGNKTNDSSLNNNIIIINKNEYTDEFRKLQKGSLELDEDKVSRFHRGTQQFTEAEQQRLGGIYERLLSNRSSLWNKYGINLTGKGNTFKIAQVDGQLFHDIFQINRQYLRNGELVDLHDNYNNAKCYITSDGLQGFAIEDNGNLVSVFSLNSARVSSKMGFLYAIKDFIKEHGATHLDCYNPSGQPLMSIYEKVFGFKPAATMDYNMEYDHDNIAKNYGNPKVVFMVANNGNIENKHFDKDSYDDAVAYQLKNIGSKNDNTSQQYTFTEEQSKIRDYQKNGTNSNADVIVLDRGTLWNDNTEYIVKNPKVIVSDKDINKTKSNTETINPVQQVLSDKSTNMQKTLSLPNFEHFVYNRAAKDLKGIEIDYPWKESYLKELDSQFRRMEDEDDEAYHMSDADKQYNQKLIDRMKVILNAKDKDDYLNNKQRDYKEKLQSALSDYNKLNQQYANLLNGMTDKDGAKWCDSPFTVSEIRHIAKLVMDSISDTITDIQTQDGLAEKLFPNVKPKEGFDFKKASREDIIGTIGIENLLANAKKTFDTEHNNWYEDNCDENYDDAYNKANFIYNNWDAIVKMGADIFAFNEGVGISRNYGEHKFNTTKETQPLTDDFNNDLDEDSLNEQEGDAQEHWQVNFRTIDTMNSMSALIRQAIHECYDLDENGQPKVHPLFGLKERVDERKVTNNILNWVQGARTIDEIVDKLSAQQKNNRWLSQLITRLQDKSGANADFQSQFFGVFCKHFQLYSIVIDQDGKYTCINANAHPALTEIMNGIKGKYHLGEHPLFTSEGKVNRQLLGNDKTIDDSNPFNLKQAFKHLPEWNFGGNHKEIDMSPEKMEEYAEWLTKVTKALGYDVNQELITGILNEKFLATMVEKLHFIVQDLEGAIKMEDSGEKYDPFKYKGNHSINSAIQNFMSPIAAVLEDSVTNSFFDSGKMYQSFVIPSFTTKLFQNLTQTNDEEFNKFMMEEYGKSEWFRGKEVFNRQTKKMEVQWNVPWLKWMNANRKSLSHRVQLNFNGHNYMKTLTDPEYALSVLSEYNSEADNTAWFRIPMESNKPSEEFIRFLAYKDKDNYKSQIVDDLSDMIFMEISRIQTVLRRNLSKGDKGFIKNFDTNGRQFCFFPFLNDYITENGKGTILKDAEGNVSKDNAVLAELLQKKIKGEEELSADEEVQLRKLIKDTTAAYMQKRADNILNMMKQKGIVRASYKIKNMVDEQYIKPKDATGKSLEGEELEEYYDNVTDKVAEQAIENFLWNDYLASKNILMIMVGDTAFYKDAEDLQKRLAELHAPGIRGNINATDYEGKKVSADGKYRTVILKDFDSFKSNIIANLNEVFDRKIAQAPEHEKAAWKALKEDILKAYSEVNVADAEGYSSMTSYRKKALMFGKWGKDAEEIYKKVLAGNYTYTDLKTAFQPMKPFVYTHLEKNMGVENAPIHMMYSPFQAKNSEVLLVMADALLMHENTSRPNILRAIDNIMEDSAYDGRERDEITGELKKVGTYNGKGIDTIQFESAIKSSLQGAIDLNNFLNDKNGGEAAAYAYLKSHIYKEGTNDYDVDNYVHEASFADYCIQQEIPEHFKNHSQAHGSQTRMIIPSDLDEYYDYSKDHNDPNNIVKYEWTDDSGEKHSLDANEFRNHYESTIAANILDSLDKLALEFHLTDSEGNPIENKKERNIALSQILVKEIDSSPRYGIDLRWACSLDENGEFNIPLGDPIQCKRIEQLINSIIKNRVNKQEIPGGPIVQVSNFGTSRQLHIRFNDKNGNLMPTEEEFNKAKEEGTLTNEQKKYSSYKDYIHENQGGIAYFEVFAPIWSDEIAEKFMDENGNIDIKAIEETNPEMLKLITYRIPTEDKYSMAPCKIVGFMPREAGNTIMHPYELTTIDDSDFDIDKRYVMRKDYRIIESKKKVGKYLYKKAEELIANEKKAPLTHDDKQTLHDKVDTFLDIINRPDADKILNGRLDKELRRLYQEIHNDKNIMKHCYTTTKVKEDSKQFNDNEIVNMSWAVLTNSTSADKMLNPGGFELQKKVGYMVAAYKNPANANVSWNNLHTMKVDELKKLSYTQKDLAWFDTQMQFYKQNSAAAALIGIFAVNKIAHAILEADKFYIDIKEICGDGFTIAGTDFHNRMKVDPRYDTNGNIIGKVLGSLVGASADAVKDPVLNLMNINITTAGMLNTMVRLGVPFEDAALFLSQDIVTRVIDEFNKRNLSNYASIDDVIEDFMKEIEKETGVSEDSNIAKEAISKEELIDGLREGDHKNSDYKVLLAFTKLKALTDKMRNITFATRFNSISSAVGPLIVDNLIMEYKIYNFLTEENADLDFIKPLDQIMVSDGKGGVIPSNAKTGFYSTDDASNPDDKIVDISDVWRAHPILEAFKSTVKSAHQIFEAANMPTNSVKFRTILATLEKYGLTEKVFSDKKLLDQLSTFYQSFMLMASGLIDSKNLSYYINDFPKKFLEYQKDDKYSGNALIQAIKLNYSRQTNKPFLQIKITGMDAKEKEELSSAWVDLYKQNQKLAIALFQYSFFRAGIGFSPKTFMALVPVYIKNHLSKTVDDETVTYKDVYKGKYNDQIVDDNVIDQFIRNNWDNNKLVPWVNPKKSNLGINYNTKTMIAVDEDGFSALRGKMYVKTSSKGSTYLWRKRGNDWTTDSGAWIYDMVSPLGNNGEYLEINTNEIKKALADTKNTMSKDNQADLDIAGNTTTEDSTLSSNTMSTKAAEKAAEKKATTLRDMFINFNSSLANDHRAENLIEAYKKNPEKHVGILQKIFKANGLDLNEEKTIEKFKELC